MKLIKMLTISSKCTILIFFFLGFSANIFPSGKLSALQVFEQLQNKTGQWNINIEILPNGKSLLLDKSNTIFLSEKIIDLCYKNHSESEGNDRLAFLISHEFAHILNNDLDYDRILNPFSKKLSNEPVEIRKRKEINADLRAVSILNLSGFSTSHFNNINDNIIFDLYKLYGIKNINKGTGNYPSAIERVKNIIDRKEVLSNYNKLYEFGIFLLLFSNEKDTIGFLDFAVDAFRSFQNYTSLTTPELLNNLGLGYFKLAKYSLSEDIQTCPDSSDFNKFESGFVISSEVQPIRAIEPGNNTLLAEKRKINQVNYEINRKKALSCFKEAENISDDEYIPSKLNKAVLCGVNQQYEDAKAILADINNRKSNKPADSLLLAYIYNLQGIIEFCNGQKQKALELFDKAAVVNPDFITSQRNKNIVLGKSFTNEIGNTPPEKLHSSSLSDCIYNTFCSVAAKNIFKFPFGPREIYNFQFSDSDSLQIFNLKEKNSFREIEFIRLKKGGIKGRNFTIGSPKQEVLQELPAGYSIIFSRENTFYYFKKENVIFSFNSNNVLADIIVLNNIGSF